MQAGYGVIDGGGPEEDGAHNRKEGESDREDERHAHVDVGRDLQTAFHRSSNPKIASWVLLVRSVFLRMLPMCNLTVCSVMTS